MIGDFLWLDEDGDGLWDTGEDGIANVTVQLFGPGPDMIFGNGNDVLLATTVTDTEGRYLFEIAAGTYEVRLDTSTIAPGLAGNRTFDPDGTADVRTQVTVSAGEEWETADFGFNWAPSADVIGNANSGAIGDRLWIDADGDGVQDLGEPRELGLGGIGIALLYDSDADGMIDATYAVTVTDAAGGYVFENLPQGIYEVRVNGGVTPAGYTPTGDRDGIFDNRTSDPIVLAPGDVFVDADFGYAPTGGATTISGTVGLNADPGGTTTYGIAGISVALIRDVNGNGDWDAGEPIIATTFSDVNGDYAFPGLPTTDYLVWVNDTLGVFNTYTATQVQDLASPGMGPVTGLGIITDGFALIGDQIYLDRNGNGAPDVGEGLEGITVELYDSTGTALRATTATNEIGTFGFGGLTPATYVIRVVAGTLPSAVTNTVDPDGGTANQATVTITTGQIDLDQDFGYRDMTLLNTITGTIWIDRNADGTKNAGETTGAEGVTVALRDADGDIVATSTTDAGGDYSFSGVPNGPYTVEVTDLTNLLADAWKSIGPAPSANNNSQNDPYVVTVSGGVTDTTGDFGYFTEGAILSGFIWNDDDADGVQDPSEPGIAGARVALTITYPGGQGATIISVVTDATGLYTFRNLLLDENFDGVGGGEPTYLLTVTPPAGFLTSPLNQTTADLDSDDPSGQPATVTKGSENDTYDFGFLVPPTATPTFTPTATPTTTPTSTTTASPTIPTTQVFSGSKTVAGQFIPGGTILYTIRITNRGAIPQANNPGPELEDILPADLTLVTASATSGNITLQLAANTVLWNGTIPANGGQIVITIEAMINPDAFGAIIVNQGTLFVDLDGDGNNEERPLTDDPSIPGPSDPTIFAVGTPRPAPAPVLDTLGFGIALILLLAIAAWRLPRRAS